MNAPSKYSGMETTEEHHLWIGLSDEEIMQRRKLHGENRLPEEKSISNWKILLNQLKSPLVYIILAAAAVSLIVGEYTDFAIIMVVVVIDAILGFIQEFQAQKTYTSLKHLLRPTTTVIRSGERREVEVWELVPGDLLILNSGDRVPADAIVVETAKFAVNESILTGESEPVMKTPLEGVNQVYMGTTVIAGRGIAEATSTGLSTQLGQIAASLQEHIEEDTPLQVRLKAFSKTLTRIVVGFTLAILISGLIMGRGFLEMLRTSIILAIAAVPEGLLIAVTVILVLGMRKILKRNGLAKKLLAVETLGSVTTICTDKTGTLTEGNMGITRASLEDSTLAVQVMVFCNDLEGPVDLALWEYARTQIGGDPQTMIDRSHRLSEEPFSSESKFMQTTTEFEGQHYDFLKGAPEIVLDMCTLPSFDRNRILSQMDEWAGEGLRTLGLAYRPKDDGKNHSGFTWVGLVGMEDPIRQGVVESIETAQKAGIHIKMITGDYRRTAEKIGRNIGLIQQESDIIDGEELNTLSDKQLQERVAGINIFARIHPQDKLRIVRALQTNGEVTAMIGDGVNDAPALKRANIGVVVGNATDVAKETADLILLDNNFKTIVAAVEEGRVIFENIRKVVAYVLSNSFAEVLLIFIAMLLGWPAPLTVAQILWIHLICDGPSDIVLGFEPQELGIMNEKPKSLKEPILPPLSLTLIAIISSASALAGLLIFGYYYKIVGNPELGRSIVFASFAVNSLVYIFAYRSMRLPIYKMPPLSQNKPLIWAVIAGFITVLLAFLFPGLRKALGIVPLNVGQFGLVAGIGLSLLCVVEVGKALNIRLHTHKKN